MRTETRTVYTFDELNDETKSKVLDNWRNNGIDADPECIFDDFATICELIGVTLATRSVPLMNGDTRLKPIIYYSGFSSQGDGACFEGSYSYRKNSVKLLKAYAPQDSELLRIVTDLQRAQRTASYQLDATMRHSGHYSHAMCVSVTVDRGGRYCDVSDDQMDTITELMRDLANWLYSQLEKEYEYANSDEAITETILCNEYEFYEDGSLV
jgi:hypothetical protein